MLKRGRNKIIVELLCCFIVFMAVMFFGLKNISAAADDHLLINEVYPNPVTAGTSDTDDIKYHEWIELYNPTEEKIDLTDWTIVDDETSSKPIKLHEIIPEMLPDSFLVLENGKDFYFTLSNTDEVLILKNGAEIIDQISYDKSEKGQSYSFFGADGWKWTKTPTPEEKNVLTEEETVDEDLIQEQIVDEDEVKVEDSPVAVEDARNLENGEDVVVTGTVTTLPGVLSSQYFYIQDETGGIQVYCHGKTFPMLILGDTISVAGELSQTNNERRIKIKSADNIIILNHTDPIVPEEVAISDIGEENEGTYVKTAGIVTETSGDTFYISDGNSEIKVVINKTTGINKPKMKKGDQVEVTGIVSQYKDEYRILPIDQDDVKIVASEDQLPRAGGGESIYFIIGLFATVLWNIFLKAKRKLLRLLVI